MNNRVKILLLIALISTLFFFYSNLVNKNKQHEELQFMLLYKNFGDLHQQIYKINETLDLYEEDFTDQEKALFKDSLVKDSISIQHIRSNINYLDRTGNGKLILYFYGLEVAINQIALGKITDEDEIKKVSTALKQHGKILSDMIFVEQVGYSSMDDEEAMKKFSEFMEDIYKDLSEITEMK